jgi:lipid-A-disaccharide synthase
MMAVVFPFEAAFYTKHSVPVKFVGHPLVNEVNASNNKSVLREEFGLDIHKTTIGLLPGSRRSEIKRLFSIILESARLTKSQLAEIQFVLPLADTLDESELAPALGQYADLNIRLVKNRAYDVIACCDVVLTVSGTVTLEIALLKTPMIIINKVAWLTYIIVRRMIKIDHIGLCNIVANKRIVPELIQHDATPEKISGLLVNLISEPDLREKMIKDLSEIETMLGAKGGIENMAELTLEMLQEDT